jgi:hypothetical protein
MMEKKKRKELYKNFTGLQPLPCTATTRKQLRENKKKKHWKLYKQIAQQRRLRAEKRQLTCKRTALIVKF